jgi:predicted heme/steroid binding protein
MKYLIKIDRIAAWMLFASMLAYFVSGYGMTKGIIDPAFAASLHTKYLPTVIILAFSLHTSFAIHLALKRWRWWNLFTKILLVVFYVTITLGFLYYEYLYVQPIPKIENTQGGAANTTTQQTNIKNDDDDDDEGTVQTTPQAVTNTPTTSTVKTFTVADLAKYNGQNGQPAYVAVDGSVYDVTKLFKNGFHYSHFAGRDLTNEFYAEHAKSKLAKYSIIGQLK